MNKGSISVLCDESKGIHKREPSLLSERWMDLDPSPFGSHDFSVAATEPGGLDRTKKGGSYTPN